MNRLGQWSRVVVVLVLLLPALGPSPAAQAAPTAPAVIPAAIGGFISAGGVSDPNVSVGLPSLGLRRAISIPLGLADGPHPAGIGGAGQAVALEPWLAAVEGSAVVVRVHNPGSGAWEPRGGALNYAGDSQATQPSLDFAGPEQAVPWVAYAETGAGPSAISHVLAAYFDGADWQHTGAGVNGPPAINRDDTQNAGNPALSSRAGELPWVTWREVSPGTGTSQIYVSRAISIPFGFSGFGAGLVAYDWEPVGGSLNFDPLRSASSPDLVFSGEDGSEAWVVWAESGLGRPGRVFASRRVITPTLQVTGLEWQVVGRQASCGSDETACALNLDASHEAAAPRIASGMLPGETVPTPWIVFTESSGTGLSEVRALRLDRGEPADPADDHFVDVGEAINVSCLARRGLAGQGGSSPDISLVGNVPHVAWVESQAGLDRLYVCHLLDARPGQEVWDLDSNPAGVNRGAAAPAAHPSLDTTGHTPYVAWEESTAAEAAGGIEPSTGVFAALRYPTGPAWGTTYAPFVPCPLGLSPSAVCPPGSAAASGATLTAELRPAQAEPMVSLRDSIGITTSCNHVDGWRNIEEIQFALYDAETEARVFLGRYVPGADPATGLIYVEDPANPGTFFDPVQIGSSVEIDNGNVVLQVGQMTAQGLGPQSPGLHVDWVFVFRAPGRYVEALNLVYAEPALAAPQQPAAETDFFVVGEVTVASEVFLPIILR